MKVAVPIIVDVDPQAYREEYGETIEEASVSRIREDIRYRIVEAARIDLNRFSFTNEVNLRP